MILKLNGLILTSVHSGNALIMVLSTADHSCNGMMHTGSFLITALDNLHQRVWISSQAIDSRGEGMECEGTKLEDFLIKNLLPVGLSQAEVSRQQLNTAVSDFYRRVF